MTETEKNLKKGLKAADRAMEDACRWYKLAVSEEDAEAAMIEYDKAEGYYNHFFKELNRLKRREMLFGDTTR